MQPTEEQSKLPFQPHPVNQVTTVSKYLALVLFILLPFIGGYIGYLYAPEKVVEVERVVVQEVIVEVESETPDYSFLISVAEKEEGLDWPIYATNTVSITNGSETKILYQQNERCVENKDNWTMLEPTNGRNTFMVDYITSYDQLISSVTCWVAGGGYEMYMYKDSSANTKVIGFTVSEVSGAAQADLSPFGEVEILYP